MMSFADMARVSNPYRRRRNQLGKVVFDLDVVALYITGCATSWARCRCRNVSRCRKGLDVAYLHSERWVIVIFVFCSRRHRASSDVEWDEGYLILLLDSFG
jgi:hypothetical protein